MVRKCGGELPSGCKLAGHLRRNGIVLSPGKFVFVHDSVEFAGLEISRSHVKPSSKYSKAKQYFPTPKNITDVRSRFDLVNQVCYHFSMTEKMLPFKNLLQPNTKFVRTYDLDAAFILSEKYLLLVLAVNFATSLRKILFWSPYVMGLHLNFFQDDVSP